MGVAAASTSKSICGWTWHSALNIIPPWSTLFLHVYLVTAVTDWEGRVYPAAVGIALLTHDFQPHTARASRNVCNQSITKKNLERLFMTPVLAYCYFSCTNGWLIIQRLLFWELSAGWESCCERTIFTCVMQRGSFRERAMDRGLVVVPPMAGLFPGAPRQQNAS